MHMHLHPVALKKAKTLWSFDRSECNRVKCSLGACICIQSLFTNVVPGNDVTYKGCLGSVLCHVCYNGLLSKKLFCYV